MPEERKLGCPIRSAVAIFGVACYLYFFWVFLCFVSFLANGADRVPALAPYFPFTVDGSPYHPLASGWSARALIDLGLLVLWVVHHIAFTNSLAWGYAEAFTFLKDAQRSFDVAGAAAFMHLLFHFWQPLDGVIYSLSSPYNFVLLGLYFFGVLFALISTFALEHFELFGLRQSLGVDVMGLVGFESAVIHYCCPVSQEKGLLQRWTYNLTRHPVFTGFLMMFWFAEALTYSRLLFAVVWSTYIVIDSSYAVEPMREKEIGHAYKEYAARVPLLCPFTKCGVNKVEARSPEEGTNHPSKRIAKYTEPFLGSAST